MREGSALYNLSVAGFAATGPGCGTQHTSRVVNNAYVLLAAAPTATPFIRHWRRLLLLLLVGEPLAKGLFFAIFAGAPKTVSAAR